MFDNVWIKEYNIVQYFVLTSLWDCKYKETLVLGNKTIQVLIQLLHVEWTSQL